MDIDSILKSHGIGGGGSNIKSIQRGTYQMTWTTGSVTISSVDVTKSIIKITLTQAGTASEYVEVTATIANATTINFVAGIYDSGNGAVITWEVIEFNNVKSLQKGSFSKPTGGINTTSISSVNLSKSILFFSFQGTTSLSSGYGFTMTGIISDSTQLTFQNQPTDNNMVISWQVIEFN